GQPAIGDLCVYLDQVGALPRRRTGPAQRGTNRPEALVGAPGRADAGRGPVELPEIVEADLRARGGQGAGQVAEQAVAESGAGNGSQVLLGAPQRAPGIAL